MEAHRLPVMAALRAGTDLKPLADLLLQDVAAVCWFSSLGVDVGEEVLVDRFLVAEKLAGFAIDSPQDSGLADGEQQLAPVEIYQDTFDHLVHVEALAGRMLEVPLEPAGVRVERQRGTREQRLIAGLGATADTQPGFGLGHAPIGDVEPGIVAAGDPRIAARAQQIGQSAPCVAAGLAFTRNGAETPARLGRAGTLCTRLSCRPVAPTTPHPSP